MTIIIETARFKCYKFYSHKRIFVTFRVRVCIISLISAVLLIDWLIDYVPNPIDLFYTSILEIRDYSTFIFACFVLFLFFLFFSHFFIESEWFANSSIWPIIIIIIIIIMSCHRHGYPWPSLATSPYHSSPLAGLQGYILCPHIAVVCKFKLVVLLLLGHMWGFIGVQVLLLRDKVNLRVTAIRRTLQSTELMIHFSVIPKTESFF